MKDWVRRILDRAERVLIVAIKYLLLALHKAATLAIADVLLRLLGM